MVKFTITAGNFLSVLKYTQATGRNIKGEEKPFLEDCLAKVFKTELKILAIDEHEALITDLTLKLKEVEEMGELPINLEKFIDIVKRFESKHEIKVKLSDADIIAIERAKPKLNFKDKTIAIDNVKSIFEANPFEFKDGIWMGKKSGFKVDSYIKIDASEFKEIVLDGEQIKHRSFPISCIGGKLEVTVEDSESGSQIVRELKCIEMKVKEDLKSVYTLGFGNVFGKLEGIIEIWIANQSPMIIRKKTDEMELIYVLSTMELEEEPVEEKKTDKKTATVKAIEKKAEELLADDEDPDAEITDADFDEVVGKKDELEDIIAEEEHLDESEEEVEVEVAPKTKVKIPKRK